MKKIIRIYSYLFRMVRRSLLTLNIRRLRTFSERSFPPLLRIKGINVTYGRAVVVLIAFFFFSLSMASFAFHKLRFWNEPGKQQANLHLRKLEKQQDLDSINDHYVSRFNQGSQSGLGSESPCVMPRLDPFDSEVIHLQSSLPPLVCSSEENWVYVQNGTVRIAETARKQGAVTCDIKQWEAEGSFGVKRFYLLENIPDGFPMTSDFFTIKCTSPNGRQYSNIHLGVAFKPHLHMRGQTTPLPPGAMGGYDVLMLGFDSVSRMSWYRNLAKTRRFFVNELGGIELESHNILGDGTVAALMPLLCGHAELDLPSTRRGYPSAVRVDSYPFIWKTFKEAGYVTAWGEDMSYFGTFEMRLTGFKESPVDHYLRHYFDTSEKHFDDVQPTGCIGSELKHVRFFNFFKDMYHMYGAKRKFMFGFHSELTHAVRTGLKWADKDLTDILRSLSTSGYLNHTILILMSDHGSRYSDLRETQQGKLEERLPYFGIRFPPDFVAKYPTEVEQVRLNGKHLTTMYDVHETFHDLLDIDPLKPTNTKGRGISLFKPIPETRTCSQAGIQPHWCACLTWMDASHDLVLKLSAATTVVDYINSLTKKVRDRCEELSLHRVLSVAKYVPQQEVLAFVKSADRHGDIPDLSDPMEVHFEYLQVVFLTTPGRGRFEATVKHCIKRNDFQVRSEDISRTNKYGNASNCVVDSYPSLRAYCYCKNLVNVSSNTL